MESVSPLAYVSRLVLALGGWWCASCAPAWDGLAPVPRKSSPLVLVPERVAGKAVRSVRFYVAANENPRLFGGGLTQVQVNNIRRGDVSKALEPQERSLWTLPSHGDAGAEVVSHAGGLGNVWSPTALLEPSTDYTLIGEVEHVSFTTLAAGEPLLARIWPSRGETVEVAVYCVTDSHESEAAPVAAGSVTAGSVTAGSVTAGSVTPGSVTAGSVTAGSVTAVWATEHILFGFDHDSSDWSELAGERPCWVWSPVSDAQTMSPARVGSFGVEATVVNARRAVQSPTELECSEEESALGTGCVEVLDDRLHIRATDSESLWLVSVHDLSAGLRDSAEITAAYTDLDAGGVDARAKDVGVGDMSRVGSPAQAAVDAVGGAAKGWRWSSTQGGRGGWFAARPREVGVIKGLSPNTRYAVTWTVFYPDAVAEEGELTIETGPPRPHIVINEVMADPIGPEPDQEWVELFNDGATAVNLQGWLLRDDGNGVVLPSYEIAPSGYLLLVNDTYVRSPDSDVVPEADAAILRLPTLGASGLSNDGEALRLMDESRMVVSSFPGIPKPTAGVSVARRTPWLSSADVHSFALHAAPGASPGSANRNLR